MLRSKIEKRALQQGFSGRSRCLLHNLGLIVIDLGGFNRGDIHLSITQKEYFIVAKRGEHEFRETITLPMEVEMGHTSEHFRNGVLEIVLPRKRKMDAL
jgi:HSP20 family molecular chaperone IbpA